MITEPNAVLVLGAGASAQFGMPLGEQLISEVRKLCVAQIDSARRLNSFHRSNNLNYNREFSFLRLTEPRFHDSDLRNRNESLRKRLENQTSETIDDFIVQNPDLADIAKVAMAKIFFDRIYTVSEEPGGSEFTKRDFAKRYQNQNREKNQNQEKIRNWVHLLINIARTSFFIHKKKQKIRIITFNYDIILEDILEKQFFNTGLCEEQKNSNKQNYEDYFEIAHAHGKFPQFKDPIRDNEKAEQLESEQLIVDWAKSIHVVNENDENNRQLSKDREKIESWVQQTKNIYFCGFSFAGPNCRNILNLGKKARKIDITDRKTEFHVHNFKGDAGIDLSVQKWTKGPKNGIEPKLYSGTRERPLNIADWIKSGALGEMPG